MAMPVVNIGHVMVVVDDFRMVMRVGMPAGKTIMRMVMVLVRVCVGMFVAGFRVPVLVLVFFANEQ